jgi:YHS domain-containing protein
MQRNLSALGLVAGLSGAAAAPSFAADELNTTPGHTAAGAPLAMRGYDPVAFFTVSKPTEGSAQFAAVHEGATYYFASRENLEAFQANPDRFVPAYGGYCAFGVSVGKKFDGDPRYWTIFGDRLYVNLNEDIAKKFKQDVAGSVAKATAQWKDIQHKAVGSL